MKTYDVVVLGAGSAGELIANTLSEAGKSVALIEELRVGGECAYVSCMPSKAMLRSSQVRSSMKDSMKYGATSEKIELDDNRAAFESAVQRRNAIAENRSDAGDAKETRAAGVELVRGTGVFSAKNRITVGEIEIGWTDLIISTGSSPSVPEIEGLSGVEYWTSDVALSSSVYPESILIIGGGAVGCELAQIYSRFGVPTTIVEFTNQLAGKEPFEIAARLAQTLADDGVKIILNSKVVKVEKDADGKIRVHLSGGDSITVKRLVVAAGRHANTADLNLAVLGIVPEKDGSLLIDSRCRVIGEPHIWAAGDVAGIEPYTHTANYQGRIIIDNILGIDRVASYVAIPRAIYTDPPVASVGVMHVEGSSDGLISASLDLSDVSRTHTDSEDGGLLILTLDPAKKVLVGAAAIGPHADEWLAEVSLAIRAQVPLAILCDVVHAFPTYGQAFEQPLRELAAMM
jgi:pyruvate/2-oxoglutarate dehydrogenase complex dihydrolipoamide dehydrogenase (E3) component